MDYWNYETSFGVGARVKVIRQRKYPEYKLLNLVGTVRTDSGTNVSVIIDGVKNPRSAYGCFYFKAVDLVEADVNEHDNKNMEENNMANCKITKYLNTAKVQFVNGSDLGVYHYANFDETLTECDLCAVVTENGTFRLARVVEIVPDNDKETYREVIAKIDTRAYDERVERREKAAELKAKMEERAKQLQDIALYQLLAKDDSAMMDLLKEYQAINNM